MPTTTEAQMDQAVIAEHMNHLVPFSSCPICLVDLPPHDSHEEFEDWCTECQLEMNESAALAGTGGTSYSKAEFEEGMRIRGVYTRPI